MAEKNSTSEWSIDLDLSLELLQKLNTMAGEETPETFIAGLVDQEWRRRNERLLKSIRLAARSNGSFLRALRNNGIL